MSSIDQGPVSTGLVNRVKGILLQPNAEWDRIAVEPATEKGLYTGYACILAAIPVVAALIGSLLQLMPLASVLGYSFLTAVTVQAILTYLFGLVGLYVTAVIVEQLAPSFGGVKDRLQALKLVVYASTATWVAGVLNVIPALGMIASLVGAVYGVYLLYLGLPKLMKSPADKTVIYLVVAFVVAVVVNVVMLSIVGMILTMANLTGAAGYAATTALYR